jgi:hypothetical protein
MLREMRPPTACLKRRGAAPGAMRAAAGLVATAAAATVLLAGCDVRSLTPFASFETRCAAMAPARFHVDVVPLTVTEDDTTGVAELTTKSGASPQQHRTYGLTVVNFGHETDSRLHMLEEKSSGRTCATPDIDVALSMRPATVYIARELSGNACQHEATRQHEMQHVDAYRTLLDEAAVQLRAELPATVAASWTGPSAGDIRARFDAEMRSFMRDFMRAQHQRLAERQALIDTPEEYERVGRACRGR